MKPKPKAIRPQVAKARDAELRVLALQMFVSSVERLDVSDMLLHQQFAGVARTRMDKWKHTDCWEERRSEFQTAVYKKFVDKASDRVSAFFMDTLRKLEPLDDKIHAVLLAKDFFMTDTVKLLSGYLEILEAKAKYTEQAAKLLTPGPGATQNAPQIQSGTAKEEPPRTEETFSEEEAKVAAAAILKLRYEAGSKPPQGS